MPKARDNTEPNGARLRQFPVTFGEILIVLGGLLLGGVVALMAVGMTGFGHGWGSAFTSAISVVGAPMAGVAWGLRKRFSGTVLAIISLAIGVGADVKIYFDTLQEGTYYAKHLMERSPMEVWIWAALFASWQIFAAVVPVYYALHRWLSTARASDA